ncbi:trypsin-like serine protease [Streptomyces sp. NPDC004732]|uniref:trypsin-like serine peptidase n=1 Tax=Streptomyces sp. NPDC004732 TaxID=3154290 RepID=UPI0033B57880
MNVKRNLVVLAALGAAVAAPATSWAAPGGPSPSATASTAPVPEPTNSAPSDPTKAPTNTPPAAGEPSPTATESANETDTTGKSKDPRPEDVLKPTEPASDLEKFWTAERMAQAEPVAEQQARDAKLPEQAKPPRNALRSPSHEFGGIKEVGTFYWADRDANGNLYYRFCAGTVVPSKGKNMVLTAGHCFDSNDLKEKLVFVPQHTASKQAPHGIFPIAKGQIYVDPRYKQAGGDKKYTDLDFGFLKTEPRSDGKKLQDVVGAIEIGYNQGFDHQARVIGYPYLYGNDKYKPNQNPLDCSTKLTRFKTGAEGAWQGGTFSEVNCDGYVSGTSGGPFIIGGNNPKVVGVTGGWKTGGHSPNTSYSSYFDGDLKRIFDAAESGIAPAPNVLPAASTWKHAKDLTAGYFTLDGPVSEDRMDMFVRWSDGELTLYRGADKHLNNFDKEFKVQGPNDLWKNHAKQVVAGDFTGDNGSDLVVRWSDGEVTLYPSVDEKGLHGEVQLVAPNETWKHAEAMTAGRYGGNKWQDDLVVRWSDGELTIYQNTGDNKKLGKEIKVVSPGTAQAETWKHAVELGSGDYAAGDTWDLIVRWSDGELTNYEDFTGTGSSWGEHKWKAPSKLWTHATLVAGGDFTDNPHPDDTLVRWSDGELSLYWDGDANGIGREKQLVAP